MRLLFSFSSVGAVSTSPSCSLELSSVFISTGFSSVGLFFITEFFSKTISELSSGAKISLPLYRFVLPL
jgi:uncharacterized protein (UPF0212 family)